jgi:DNA-binding CsgD family transcriptional regulator
VLELMAEGLQDDAIARRAGISTSAPTHRRHHDQLGVSGRLVAVAAAYHRGWIG